VQARRGNDQKKVALDPVSMAQAHVDGKTWFRAVYDEATKSTSNR